MPRDASPDLYCRRGLEWALRGQAQLPPREAADLRALTQKLYGAMTERNRARLGQYLERLRQVQPTTAAEDHEMNALMSSAARKMAAADQERLRGLTKLALEVGRLL